MNSSIDRRKSGQEIGMSSQLPQGLTELDRAVRLSVYRHFIDHAGAPSHADLATQLKVSVSSVQESLLRLETERALALTPSTNNIWMAHPFSAVPTAYPVQTATHTYWANCAWDALAIPALLGVDSETTTVCPDCAEPITLRVRDKRLGHIEAVVHYVVPPRRFWENVGFT
jgi:hypothetical protein